MDTRIFGNKSRSPASGDALIRQAFRTLLPVQILSFATPTLTSILTGILIGNYLPPDALVALGFVVPFNAFLAALATIVSSGARVICGRLIGRGELKQLDSAFTSSVAALTVLGAVITLLMLFFSAPVAGLLGATGSSAAATAEYLRGLAVGIIPMLIIPCLMVFLQMENESSFALISTVVLAVCSLVFGLINLKLFDGDIYGMGIASSLSQFVSCAFIAVHIARSDKLVGLDLRSIKRKLLIDMLKFGAPAAFASILYPLRNAVLNVVALKYGGPDAVASLAILCTAAAPFDAVNVGFGAVVLMFASVIIGERDSELLKSLFRVSIRIGIVIAVIKVIVFAVFSKYLALLFGAAPEILGQTVLLLVLYTICMPLNIITVTFASIYQNLGKLRYMNILYIFSCFVIPIGFSYCFGSLLGVWLSYGVAEAITVIILVAVPCIKNGKFTLDIKQLLMLDKGFESGEKLSLSVHSVEDAIGCSESIRSFCLKNGIDSRRSMLCSLCAEEMAVNVVTHGFTKTKKRDLGVEIFLLLDDGRINLRIMDNAPHFEPAEKLKYTDNDDPCKNIGIRMVTKIAEEMDYHSTFNMNSLRMRL